MEKSASKKKNSGKKAVKKTESKESKLETENKKQMDIEDQQEQQPAPEQPEQHEEEQEEQVDPEMQRLAKLWREGDRERAITFLRKVWSNEITLQEFLHACTFEGVKNQIQYIQMREILPRTGPVVPTAPSAPRMQVVPQKEKRTRRSADQVQEVQNQMLRIVQNNVGTISTVDIMDDLQKQGQKVDTVFVNLQMKKLVDANEVVCLGGKPKSYRAVTKGAQTATPFTINKKQDQEEAS